MARNKLKIVLPLIVIVVGIAAAVLLASSRKAPPRVERPALGPLVEVTSVHRVDVPVVITGHGQVGAKVAVELVPQVAGKVVEVHPALVAGGFFKAGQALVVIEPSDYELAVERATAAVARGQVRLEQERAEADVAREEWSALHPGEEPPSGLVVREPQVRQAEAELVAAEADLHGAQLNLDRTRVSVPFDGIVVRESVDVGQYIAPGQSVATVYGTDVVEVRLPLEDRELAWFDVPRRAGDPSPRAELSATFAGALHTWDGRVTRMEAEVDAASRMINVVVEVQRPFAKSGSRPPLMPGTFVDVRIFGNTLEQVVSIPRFAVHDGGAVWVVDDGAIRVTPVDVVRSDRETAYIRSGLESGDLVVVSSLDAVTDGMRVRTAGAEGAAESGPDQAGGETVAFLDARYWILDAGLPPNRADLQGGHSHELPFGIQGRATSIKHLASSIRAGRGLV
jgi:RND family efflux transporter MFP subunit